MPWSRGEDFGPDYEWSPEEANLTAEARSALFVNVLTEENLRHVPQEQVLLAVSR